MKILHVIPSLSDRRGGPSRAVLDMVKALQLANVDVCIAATNDDGPELLDVPVGCCVDYQAIPVYFFPRFSPAAAPIREFAFSAQFTKWLWENVSSFDLLHVHAVFSYPSTIAMTIARQQRVPYVVTLHGLLCRWAMQQSKWKKQIYLTMAERANLNYAKMLHFTSDYERHETATHSLRAPSMVVPFGFTVPPIIPNARHQLREWLNLEQDEPIILFMSRLHPVKGLDFLIPALGKLTNYRFTFIMAGSGPPEYETEIQRMLAEARLQKRTRCVGFAKGETKNLLLQGADLFVQTSRLESFGVAVLEALAANTPVLVTPGVATAVMVQQHKLGYVTELDISSIANTIANFLEQISTVDAAQLHTSQYIKENFAWEKIALTLSTLYETILTNEAKLHPSTVDAL